MIEPSKEAEEFISDLLAREAQNSLIESLTSQINIHSFAKLFYSLYRTTPAFQYNPNKVVGIFAELGSNSSQIQRYSLQKILFGGFLSYVHFAQIVMIKQKQIFKIELAQNRLLVENIKHRLGSQMTKDEFKEFLRMQFSKDAKTRVVMGQEIFKSRKKLQFGKILMRLLLDLEKENEEKRDYTTQKFSQPDNISPYSEVDFDFKSPERASYEEEINRQSLDNFQLGFKFYLPSTSIDGEISYIFKLGALLRDKKIYKDPKPPQCPKGQYLPAANIFNRQSFKLFASSSSVDLREPNRIGLEREIEPKDIKQGKLGTCGCLSCFASCAFSRANNIYGCFVFEDNPAGYYVGKMYLHGRLKYIETDERFPCFQGQLLSAQPHGKQLWVLLLQKMLAKLFGSYDEIVGRKNSDIMRALTGAPTVRHSPLTVVQLTEELTKIDQNKFFATVLAKPKFMSEQLKVYEAKQHSFSYLEKYELESAILVKLMNPWGTLSWTGDWSFKSEKWTPELRDQLGYKRDRKDGSFYISIQDFYLNFEGLVVCRIRNSFKHTQISLPDCSHQKYFRTTIPTDNIYTLAIHLDSASRELYMRIIVMRETEDSLIFVQSRVSDPYNKFCDIQSYFEKGTYVIAVFLDCKAEKIFTLTCYGPEQIKIQAVESFSKFSTEGVDKYFNRQLLMSYSQQLLLGDFLLKWQKHIHRKKMAEKVTIVLLEIRQHGLGLIKVENGGDQNGKCTWKAQMELQAMGGEEMKPLTVHVAAGTSEIRGYYFLKRIGDTNYAIDWKFE